MAGAVMVFVAKAEEDAKNIVPREYLWRESRLHPGRLFQQAQASTPAQLICPCS
jgi:hypothetical protein